MTTDRLAKDTTNIQWGRISEDGADPVPADVDPAGAEPNQGHEPLVDNWGRPWVRVASSGPNFSVQTGFYQTTILGT